MVFPSPSVVQGPRQQAHQLDVIFAKEGIGWEIEASAIMAGTDKLEAAQKFMDWTITRRSHGNV